ncbi:MAG: endonuclease III domain-containing protein [Infirmifilum sp.]
MKTKECMKFLENINEWYLNNLTLLARKWRLDRDPFRSVMIEILLIRTRREAVEKIYDNFFSRFKSPDDILNATDEELKEAIYTLGMRKRIVLLKKAAEYLKARGIKSPSDIEELPGAGEYVKNILKLKLFNTGSVAVDRNGARVLFRYFYGYVPEVEKLEKRREIRELREKCLDLCEDRLTLSYALMDLGYYICKPRKPECGRCPLKDACRYARGTP